MKNQYTKPPLPVEDQVALLQSRGLNISDPERAGRYLLSIGYYRLSAYCVPFEISHGRCHQFRENVSFDDILDLYVFDRKLRCLFWEALERTEIHIRTQWVYNLTTLTQDPFVHLNPCNFSDPADYQQDLKKLKEEVRRSNKETFVKHFFDHYNEALTPLWACVHLMTLGELIRWVDNTQNKCVKKEMAQSSGFTKYRPFHSFAVALTELRNVCAHHVRLWNRSFMKSPMTVKSLNVPGFQEFLPIPSSNKLYVFAVLLSAVLRAHNPKTSWPARLGDLLSTRTSLQLASMGFPPNWKQYEVWGQAKTT